MREGIKRAPSPFSYCLDPKSSLSSLWREKQRGPDTPGPRVSDSGFCLFPQSVQNLSLLISEALRVPLRPPCRSSHLLLGTTSAEGQEQLRGAGGRERSGLERAHRSREQGSSVFRGVSRPFHRYRDVGQRGTEKFQRFFTCKRIFPLRVSRLNNTPCV